MIVNLIFVFAALHRQAPTVTATGLVSRMFDRYYKAKTLGGNIRTTQSAGGATVVTETNLAYERPGKLRLEQRQRLASGVKQKWIVSDGAVFRYTPPERIITADGFVSERIKASGHADQTVADLYAVIAADLPDRSPMLDAFIARPEDLTYFKNQLTKLQLGPMESVNGRPAYSIEGDWREIESVLAVGHFKMDITEGGELLRYVLTQSFAAPGVGGQANGDPITVTTTWESSVTVDAPIKAETFAFRP